MMLYKSFSRKILLAATLALLPVVVVGSPAQAGGSGTCTGDLNHGGGIITCGNGNGNGGPGSTVDHSWDAVFTEAQSLATPGYGACVSNGQPSYLSPLTQPSTGAYDDSPQGIYPHPCVGKDPLGFTVSQAQAVALLHVPQPEADYKQDFLTGAPVKFSVAQQAALTAEVPGFPGAFISASPIDFTWDFGDGHTGSVTCQPTDPTCEATHTYQSTTPNPANPTNHTVSVTVTGTWRIYVHQPSADPTTAVADIGTVQLQGTLNPNPRTIVQVWSAQTEPTN